MSVSGSCLSAADLIAAFDLPPVAMCRQRLPKKLLAEHVAATVADRKLIQTHIEEALWLAALKPSNAGVAAYRDAQRSYLELALLCVTLRPSVEVSGPDPGTGKISRSIFRLAELLHRAIPYPIVLLLEVGNYLYLSLAHIRWAQQEADKTVLDGELYIGIFAPLSSGQAQAGELLARADFLAALALSKQPRLNLFTLYQGWLDTLCAWQAVALTGRFLPSSTPEQAVARRAALRRCRELDTQIAGLRVSGGKEKQVARQVAANLEIKALQVERQQVVGRAWRDG